MESPPQFIMENYEKTKKKEKEMICEPEMSSGVGYVWRRY